MIGQSAPMASAREWFVRLASIGFMVIERKTERESELSVDSYGDDSVSRKAIINGVNEMKQATVVSIARIFFETFSIDYG